MRQVVAVSAIFTLAIGAVLCLTSSAPANAQTTQTRLPVPPPRQCPMTLAAFPRTDGPLGYPLNLMWAEWMRIGGPNGRIGCPISRAISDDRGQYIQFEHGQIAVSTDKWEHGAVAAYKDGFGIRVDWTVSWDDPSHYNYSKFIVRWDYRKHGSEDFQHFEDGNACKSGDGGRGTGDQCDVLADMFEVQEVLLHYFDDTHLRTKGTFYVPPDRGEGQYRIQIEGCDEGAVGGSTCRQGWMHPLEVTYAAPDPIADAYSIDISNVASATDAPTSKAAAFARAAAYTRHYACDIPLPYFAYRNEEDFMEIIMAKLDYANYFQTDYCSGRDIENRAEAAQYLLNQSVESKAGTTVDSCPGCRTGEYDVALSGYIVIRDKLGEWLKHDAFEHVLDLLNKRGPLDMTDHVIFPSVPETENHINMIESSRFLTNEIMFSKTHEAQYDNANHIAIIDPLSLIISNELEQTPNINGVTMKQYWLNRLQNFLKTDFIEYNARPYQDYTMHSLQNLHGFSSDADIRTSAGMVLNYVYAKLAVSSNDNRRSVPFRRKKAYNDPNLLATHSDPQSGRLLMLAGDFNILKQLGQTTLKAPNYGSDQWAIESNYTIPDPILDLILNHQHRFFYQGFHHYADEIYAGSPSYLISAGGHYATHAYKFPALGFGSGDDVGNALPTTIMPSGIGLSRNDLIRFEGDPDDTVRSNMCVAPDFACGLNPVLPGAAIAVGVNCIHVDGRWTFINFTQGCRNDTIPSGNYVALYQGEGPDSSGANVSFGFAEVFDAWVNPAVTFEDFSRGPNGVLARNGSRTYRANGPNVYVTTTGREITFEVAGNHSYVAKILNGPSPVESTSDFATGTILQSAGGSGLVTIANPFLGVQIVLDSRDRTHPLQRAERINAYAPDTCLSGFVPRLSLVGDTVCVTVDRRKQIQDENAHANDRRSPNGGPFGPDTCRSGFVWREATASDHVCVPPPARDAAHWDNKLAASRFAAPQF